MSELRDIPVKVVSGGNARAVLSEVASRLRQLVEKGEGNSIDLTGMPLTPEDYDLLEKTLGEGEVTAEVNSLGPTRIQETGIPGVWWVTHFNDEDEVVTEFIEVTYCPDILPTPQEDAKDGLEALRARLFGTNLTKEG